MKTTSRGRQFSSPVCLALSLVVGTTFTSSCTTDDTSPSNSTNGGGDSASDTEGSSPLSAPSGLHGVTTGCTIASLSWSSATNTGDSGLKGYKVYRDNVLLKHVAAPVTHTMDAALSASTSYSYTVSAVDLAGNESAKAVPLVLTTHAECTEWAELFHVGARYPGAGLAPIKSPYIIFGYGMGYRLPAVIKQGLPSITVVDRWVDAESLYKPWTQEGILFLARASSEKPEAPHCTQAQIDTEYQTVLKNQGYENTGIAIDEFGSIPECITYSQSALRAFEAPSKNFLVLAWFYAKQAQLAQGLDAVDVFVGEAYSSSMEEMISASNELGLDGKTIMGFGVGEPYPEVQPTDIDAQLSKLRMLSPRLASNGVGLFYLSDKTSELRWKEYNSVFESHFLQASPTVTFTAPHEGDFISNATHITCSAAPNAKTGTPIDHYRFFVDNVLEEVSKSPSFSWDPSSYTKGEHVLTIHAVAEDYRAGVTQIRVTVQ